MKHKRLFIVLGIAAAVIVSIELILYAITGAFGGIANGGVMFDPYLVTPSASRTLCPADMADSLKTALSSGCHSTAIVPHPSINGSDPYRYPSGKREFAATLCGTFNAGGTEYALLCVAFSKPTMANAPQWDIPEKVAKEIVSKMK